MTPDVLLGTCFFLIFTLVAITLVGHGMWVVCAAIVRALRRPDASEEEQSRNLLCKKATLDCMRCGFEVPAESPDCPRCGLDCEGVVAAELKDLEATARQLQRIRQSDLNADETIDTVWKLVSDRHELLVGTPLLDVPATPLAPLPTLQAGPQPQGAREQSIPREQAWVPVTPVQPIGAAATDEDIPMVIPVVKSATALKSTAPDEKPPWVRLRGLLSDKHEDALSASDRVRLVLWYRQCPARHLEELPIDLHVRLARVLKSAELADDALDTWKRCLARYSDHPEFVAAVLEAARLALGHDLELAEQFLDQIGDRPRTPDEREQQFQLLNLIGQRKVKAESTAVSIGAEREETKSTDASREPLTANAAGPGLAVQAIQAAETRVAEVAAPSPKGTEERSRWVAILAGFMEERNILWGELVGGVLIVGGSIALVVSLWNTLQANPYFPIGLLAFVTAALFGAGMYTWSHWKLHATSRGLLVIATLLVPLTFLVMPSALNVGGGDFWELIIAGGVTALFAWCLYRAASVIVPAGRWILPAAVLGCAADQMLVARIVTERSQHVLWLIGLGLIPVACQVAGSMWIREKLRRRAAFAGAECGFLFAFVGLSTFSAAVALTFLVARWPSQVLALQYLAPLFAFLSLPIVIGGLLIHKRLEQAEGLAVLRTTGTGVALAGATVMFFALAVAWPLPLAVLLVCAFNFAVLSWLAFRHSLPLVHVPAVFCLFLGYLSAFHVHERYSAELSARLLSHFVSMEAGVQLVILAVMLGAVTHLFARFGRVADVNAYAMGAGAAALLSLGIASFHGMHSPSAAALVYAIAGLGCLAASFRPARDAVSYFGLALLTGSLLWGLQSAYPTAYSSWSLALAMHALLLVVLGVCFTRKRFPTVGSVYGLPLQHLAEVSAGLAILCALGSRWFGDWEPQHILTGIFLGVVYLLLTAKQKRHLPATLFGLVSVATVAVFFDWANTLWTFAHPQGMIALSIAITCCLLAGIALALHLTKQPRQALTAELDVRNPRWYDVLPTAWREVIVVSGLLALWVGVNSPSFPGSNIHTATVVLVAMAAWLLAGNYRSAVLTWVGSLLLLFGIGHCLNWSVEAPAHFRVMAVFLLHATLLLIPSLFLQALRRKQDNSPTVNRVIIKPFTVAGLLSTSVIPATMLAVHALPVDRGPTVLLAGFAGWLTILWLALSWVRRWPVLFAGFQLATAVFVLYAVTTWLEAQPWMIVPNALQWWQPRSLQAYGIGLAGLCWLFVFGRIILQRTKTGNALLLPNSPGVDRWLLGGLLIAQLGLADWAILREVVNELTETNANLWPAFYVDAFGPGGWLLLGALGIVLLTSLWQPSPHQRQSGAVVGLAILAITVPALIAGHYGVDHKAASLLRWIMACAFLACSILVWLRKPIVACTSRLRIPAYHDVSLSSRIRTVLLDGLAVPVLLITIVLAGLLISGHRIPGPDAASVFYRMGPTLSLFLPLGAIAFALVGHALRERSPGYAFGAGLLVTATGAGGYALNIVLGGQTFGDPEWVRMLQIAAMISAVWGSVWIVSRKWIHAWRDDGHALTARPLMWVQLAIPLSLVAGMLLPGVLFLTPLAFWEALTNAPVWYPPSSEWTTAAGSRFGWIAFALSVVFVYLHHGALTQPRSPALTQPRSPALTQPRSPALTQPRSPALAVGGLGFGLVAFAACSVERFLPGQGFRALLVGLGVYCSAWSLIPWVFSLFRVEIDSQPARRYFDAAPYWVFAAAAMLVPCCLQAVFVHHDHIWGGLALIGAGVPIALLGFQRRAETPLLLGSLAGSLSAVLFVWHLHVGMPFSQWWMHVFQAAGITTLAAVIGWLGVFGARCRTGKESELSFIPFQLAFGAGCCLIPLTALSVALLPNPGGPPAAMLRQLAGWPSWIALALAVLTSIWFLGAARPKHLIHVLGSGGILLALQMAATAGFKYPGNWLTWHFLATGLGLTGIMLCFGGWVAQRGLPLGRGISPEKTRPFWTDGFQIVFPMAPTRLWVESLGIVLVALVFRSAALDRFLPWWPAFLTMLAAGMALGLAAFTKRPAYVHVLGCLLVVAGFHFWLGWGQGMASHFLLTMILSIGIASVLTAPLEEWLNRQPASQENNKRGHPTDIFSCGSIYVLTTLAVLFLLRVANVRSAQGFVYLEGLLNALSVLVLPMAALLIAGLILFSTQNDRMSILQDWEEKHRHSFGSAAGFLALNGMALWVLIGIASDLFAAEVAMAALLAWITWAVVVIAAALPIWVNKKTRTSIAALPLYLSGLLGVLLALHHWRLEPDRLCQWACVAIAAYLLIAGLLAWFLTKVDLGQKLHAYVRLELPAQSWFPITQLIFGALVIGIGLWTSCWFEHLPDRLFGPLGLLLLLPAIVSLPVVAAAPTPRLSHALRFAGLVTGAFLLLSAVWSWPSPAIPHIFLVRHILLLFALAGSTVSYGLLLPRLLPVISAWNTPAWNISRALYVLGGLTILTVLTHELAVLHPALGPSEPLGLWAIAFVSLVIVSFVVSGIWFAVRPVHDPFSLKENWRTKYIYVAEVLVFLLILHLKLTMPHLFDGPLGKYWQFFVIGLAFAGVGLSELFNRLNVKVLSVPLQRTGVFLPLLPLLMFWLKSTGGFWNLILGMEGFRFQIENLDFMRYAWYWFLAGGVFFLVSFVRQSRWFALFTALAVNFGVWSLLFNYRGFGVSFLEHPQLWLIPLALIILGAEHINRDRLSPAAAAGIRYSGLAVLYVSSAADLFIADLDISMSLVLAVLAVLGIFTGILLRVQAFLSVGFAFLTLVIGARIWHAAVVQGHTWVWWVAVICLGIAILTLFALFEKRRMKMIQMMEDFKRWK